MPASTSGQRPEPLGDPALRSRVVSGFRLGGLGPRLVARRLDDLEQLIAGIGGDCWAFGPTAAALLGFEGWQLAPPYHVVIERGRFVSRVGHVVHTSNAIPLIDRAVVEGIPTTSATRTIFDLARFHDAATLTRLVDDATRDGLTSDDFLFRELGRRTSKGQRGVALLLRVLAGVDASKGGHSWLEREFLRLVADAGLPRPLTQQVIGKRGARLIRVDVRFPATPVVVELLGYTYHRSLLQLQTDAERMNAMILRGLAPLQFTFADVTAGAGVVIPPLRQALMGITDPSASALRADVRRMC